MILPGLVSITFRKLSPREIVDLVVRAQLTGIEWGGDIHVPHGDLVRASEVGRLTREAGLAVAAYGSYYRVGTGQEFEPVLAAARELDAPTIRVWAGNADTPWAAVVEDSRRIADLADRAGIRVAYEYHGGTHTETTESTVKLLREVNHPNLFTLWQPRPGADLAPLLPWLAHLHVFHWGPGGFNDRRPLADGVAEWQTYLQTATRARFALLEYVRNDDPAQFLADAATLQTLV